MYLFGLGLEEGDQVVPVLWLLETAKSHLGAWNILLGILEVVELVFCISREVPESRCFDSQEYHRPM